MKKYIIVAALLMFCNNIVMASGYKPVTTKDYKSVWHANAMSCVPTPSTIKEEKYIKSGGRVKFKSGESGLISFTCPFTLPDSSGKYFLSLNVRSAHRGDNNSFKAKLRKAPFSNGAVETILSITNNTSNKPMMFKSMGSRAKKITFDSRKNSYWVQISQTKSATDNFDNAMLSVVLTKVGYIKK